MMKSDLPKSSNCLQIILEAIPDCPVSGERDSSLTPAVCRTVKRQKSCCTTGCSPYGTSSVCGCRQEMEDAVIAVPAFTHLPCRAVGGCNSRCLQVTESDHALDFYGVYDGHGGSQASLFCKYRLHSAIAEEVTALNMIGAGTDFSNWKMHWENIMNTCFKRVDAEVRGKCGKGSECLNCQENRACLEMVAPVNVGSTAVVAIIGLCQIIVANCGDSRAVLSRGGKAVALSNDHKPEREDELARVEAAGGQVVYWKGYRVFGVLAMSRAIGDHYLKPYVIAEPEVSCLQRTEEDEFLILASDGLWDVLSNELACDLVRSWLGNCHASSSINHLSMKKSFKIMNPSPAAAAATLLTKVALARGSQDNVTVVVVDLKVNR